MRCSFHIKQSDLKACFPEISEIMCEIVFNPVHVKKKQFNFCQAFSTDYSHLNLEMNAVLMLEMLVKEQILDNFDGTSGLVLPDPQLTPTLR